MMDQPNSVNAAQLAQAENERLRQALCQMRRCVIRTLQLGAEEATKGNKTKATNMIIAMNMALCEAVARLTGDTEGMEQIHNVWTKGIGRPLAELDEGAEIVIGHVGAPSHVTLH